MGVNKGLIRHLTSFTTVCIALMTGAGASPVAIVCPMTQASDMVNVVGNDSFQTEEGMVIRSAAYIWTSNDLPSEEPYISCDGPVTGFSADGDSCLYQSQDSLTSFCIANNTLTTAIDGYTASLDIPRNAQMIVCRSSVYSFLLTLRQQGRLQGQIALATTGCLAVTSNNPSWFTSGLNASYNLAPEYALVSGFPYTQLNGNSSSSNAGSNTSCGMQFSGYQASLTSQYFAGPYKSGQTDLPLIFGSANLTSCTCPANSAAGGAWQGLPRTYASNFGAHFSGEFLVNGSQASNLSDWRLICLQHNNAAQLTVDSTLLLNISGTSNLGAGYLQICRALQLTEGYHSINLIYGTGADVEFSVLRFFVLNAAGIRRNRDGTRIVWENEGSLCPIGRVSNSRQPCTPPLDCCRFRTQYGCGSNLLAAGAPLAVNSDPFLAPKSDEVQYVLPPFSGIGSLSRFPFQVASSSPPPPQTQQPAPAPAPIEGGQLGPLQAPLPAPAALPVLPMAPEVQSPGPLPEEPTSPVMVPEPVTSPQAARAPAQEGCTLYSEPCYLFSAASGIHMKNAVLQCSLGLTLRVTPPIVTSYLEAGVTGWLDIAGVGSANASSSFLYRLAIDTTNLPVGIHQAGLSASGTGSAGQNISATTNILAVVANSTAAGFTSVQRQAAGDSASLAASVSLDVPLRAVTVATNISLSTREDRQTFAFETDASATLQSPLTYPVSSNLSLPNPYTVPEPSVLLEAAHEVSLPLGMNSNFVCGTLYSLGTSSLSLIPECAMSATSMAYRGDGQLIASGTEAVILLYCNTQIQVCRGCFRIDGPPSSQSQLLEDGTQGGGSSRYYVHLSWPDDYNGRITLSLDQQKCQIPGNPSLDFVVDQNIPLQAAGYEVESSAAGWSTLY